MLMCAFRDQIPLRGLHSLLKKMEPLSSAVSRGKRPGGLLEKMIVPLIHFVLLGFLPLGRMRATTDPRFAAACGQILAVRRAAYEQTGGHAAIASHIHDAVALTRHFRSHGLTTDLFDATDTFHCRMYHRAADVWQGFAKNAHEGLGSSRLIVPATLLLLGGQVLPLILLAVAPSFLTLVASLAVFLPRLMAVARFRQSLLGAILHPHRNLPAGRHPVGRFFSFVAQAACGLEGTLLLARGGRVKSLSRKLLRLRWRWNGNTTARPDRYARVGARFRRSRDRI